MRNLAVAALVLGLAACQLDAETVDTTGRAAQPIIGGDSFTTGFDAVCAMNVKLPPDDEMNDQDPITCACVLVADDIVLTSASCVEQNLTADTLSDVDVYFGADADDPAVAPANAGYKFDEVELHRYYDPDQPGQFDLAIGHLAAGPTGITPAIVNTTPLTTADHTESDPTVCEINFPTDDLPDGCGIMVGYGETDNDKGDFWSRRKAVAPVISVDSTSLFAGIDGLTTCDGDSGGPMFMDIGGELRVVSIGVRQGSCRENVIRTRVDVFADEFIFKYIDRFGATCGLDGSTCDTSCPRSPDPDCDPCDWNGTCMEDCPTRDWDCDIGVFIGNACTKNGDCEENGACVAAVDDSEFTYCDRPCDPSAVDACRQGMVCDESGSEPRCVWPAPSPGSQGYACNASTECRSGICEELICVTECDPGAADPCPMNFADPDSPFNCLPSNVEPGKNVCVGTVFSGGGGFCTVGADGRGAAGSLALLAIAMLFVVTRRRR